MVPIPTFQYESAVTTLALKIKTNPKMCILVYFKLQSDQPRITRNALKSQIFDLFTELSLWFSK